MDKNLFTRQPSLTYARGQVFQMAADDFDYVPFL